MALIRALVAVACLAVFHAAASPARTEATQAKLAPETATGSSLRGKVANTTQLHAAHSQAMPCACDLGTNMGWVAPARTVPKCIFIDLGAADGNTLRDFVANKYGPVNQCPSAQWEATLVEANPRFNTALQGVQAAYQTPAATVHSKSATAAYMCEASTSFYVDTTSVENNYWGSSMSENHDDVVKSGKQKVTVPTVNVLRLLYETTIAGDYVILKMDIEGAEWDVLPCLAQASYANLVDRLFVEVHPITWGNAGTTQPQMDAAMAGLRAKGVDIPDWYHSQTL